MLIFSAVVEVAWWQRTRRIGCQHTASWDHIRQRIIALRLKHNRVSLTCHRLPKHHHSSKHATPLYWLRPYFHQWKDLVLLIGQCRQQSSLDKLVMIRCVSQVLFIWYSVSALFVQYLMYYIICCFTLTLWVFLLNIDSLVVVCFYILVPFWVFHALFEPDLTAWRDE